MKKAVSYTHLGKQCHIISAGIMVFIMIAMSIGEMAVDCTQFFRFFVHQISKYRFAFCKGHILIIFRFSGCCRCQHVGRVIAGRHQQTSQGIFHSQFFIQHMASFTGIQCHFVDFCTNCDDFIRLDVYKRQVNSTTLFLQFFFFRKLCRFCFLKRFMVLFLSLIHI